MSELGRQLSEARTTRGLSLADVEAATRIRQKYLEAWESGAYDELPDGATSRGFLRNYARFLGLDVGQAVDLYQQESGDHSADVAIAEPGSPRYVDYRPLEVELSEPTSSLGSWRWLFAVLLVGALAAVVWWLLSHNSGLRPVSLLAPRATSTPTETATPWVVTATSETVAIAQVALPALTSDLLLFPTPTVPPTITPTPRPTGTPEVVASITMDVEAAQRAWLRVLVDGEVAEEGVLREGDTRSWNADQSITLRTGNAGGIQITLNGDDLGTMGGVGEVVERSWIVDQGQVTEAVGPTPTPLPAPTDTATPAG